MGAHEVLVAATKVSVVIAALAISGLMAFLAVGAYNTFVAALDKGINYYSASSGYILFDGVALIVEVVIAIGIWAGVYKFFQWVD